MSFLLTLVSFASTSFAASTLSVEFLNVGQGDAVLIRTSDGHTALIDGGKPSGNADDQLAALGVTTIDVLVASHADYDHAGVHEDILAKFDVVEYVTNGLSHTSQSYARIKSLAAGQAATGALIETDGSKLAPGEDLGWGDLHLYVLPPPSSITSSDQNLHSIGILVEYGDFRSLITGDSEKKETDAWLATGLYNDLIADIDVYKAIHHGSKDGDANNTPWLDVALPENVVIGVGPNSYGHPTAEALATYSTYGAEVWRTDLDGRVTANVWTTGGYVLSTEGKGTVFVSGDPIPGDGSYTCPSTHSVKGNIGSEKIYHVSGGAYYSRTIPEECFASTTDAAAAGYRASTR